MTRPTPRERFQWVRTLEAEGKVADSLDVRRALLERMKAGELTLEEVQQRLKRIKREAKVHGQVTRSQAYRGQLPGAPQ
jgi:predicted nuclease with TOPRIM domain